MNLEEIAAQLHNALAADLLKRIQSGEATSAELSVARQFLKDNGIDTVARKGGNLHKLEDALPDFEGDGPMDVNLG